MYSGITQGLYKVVNITRLPDLLHYCVQFSAEFCQDLKIGASVSIDGVCQSVVSISDDYVVAFDAMAETLRLTTLADLAVGQFICAERSLCYGAEIGGHEVAGHVIGVATVVAVNKSEQNCCLTFSVNNAWKPYIFSKGFIAIDGSSLTVGGVKDNTFQVHLIPETLRTTNFGKKSVGDKVNIELDHKTKIIVDTVERIMKNREDA